MELEERRKLGLFVQVSYYINKSHKVLRAAVRPLYAGFVREQCCEMLPLFTPKCWLLLRRKLTLTSVKS